MAAILTVNAGSTSLKLTMVLDGVARAHHVDLEDALAGPAPEVVAHRVVHGGDRTEAALVDDDLVDELSRLAPLAPLHQPPALAAVERCRRVWPGVPNVVCFDTSFHSTITAAARTPALPSPWREEVRSLGFHGLSHAWAAGRVRQLVPGARRAVIAHLGGGSSLCATLDGRSVHTTLGFSTVDGLVMGTRCGSLDPGAVLWLAARNDDLGEALERRSGLLGLCGDADIRTVRARAARGDDSATFALAVWRHRAVAHLGACVALVGGLDVLAFTGGIGEHDAASRRAITDAFGWLGISTIDGADGTIGQDDTEITAPGAPVRTFVVPCREDLQMAAEATRLLDRETLRTGDQRPCEPASEAPTIDP